MNLLAIETSCDETGIAIVSGQKTPDGFAFCVLGSALLTQASLHAAYGGVYPTLAKREHQKNLPAILNEALRAANVSPDEVDALAVTEGPGLEPALWTGITFATALAAKSGKPLFGVNHLEGHLISSLARRESEEKWSVKDVRFPVLGLLISGGHTQLLASREWFQYEIIGETLDDAVGEAFDKVARMLGLPYPGGPAISAIAEEARAKNYELRIKLPRPMLRSAGCNVSFSGLKTAALYALRDLEKSRSDLSSGLLKVGPLHAEEKAAFAREFEDAVGEVLVEKTHRALRDTSAKTFVIGGGVAANKHVRDELVEMIQNEFPKIEIRLPDLSITGDNAIMIAEAALAHLLAGDWNLSDDVHELKANGNLSLASH